MDRRARFFTIAAVMCALLIWPCPPELRWVGIALTVAFIVLAVLCAMESTARRRR